MVQGMELIMWVEGRGRRRLETVEADRRSTNRTEDWDVGLVYGVKRKKKGDG